MSQLVDVTLPAAAQEGTESQVGSWFKQPGDAVKLHEPLLEIVTDKVTVEISAPADGVLQDVLKDAGEKVSPDDILGRIAVGASAGSAPAPVAAAAPSKQVAQAAAPRATGNTAMINALSPSVRRLVKQHNIDVAQIAGSGRGGRVTLTDIEAHIAGGGSAPAPARSAAPAARPSPTPMPPTQAGGSRRVPHSPMRRGIADHMVKSALQIAPHVTAIFDADLSAVMKHRNMHKQQFEMQGVKLTLTAYFIAATVRALQTVPEVNSRFHADAVELFADCNIGIAAAVPDGLVVPVIHAAQTLNLLGTARKLQDLTDRARETSSRPPTSRTAPSPSPTTAAPAA